MKRGKCTKYSGLLSVVNLNTVSELTFSNKNGQWWWSWQMVYSLVVSVNICNLRGKLRRKHLQISAQWEFYSNKMLNKLFFLSFRASTVFDFDNMILQLKCSSFFLLKLQPAIKFSSRINMNIYQQCTFLNNDFLAVIIFSDKKKGFQPKSLGWQ